MSDLRRTNNKPNEAIIVESPTKTRSLARFLGGRYLLLATKGHIRDLPERGLAVDVDNGFRPTYEIIPGQKKTVETLSKELRRAERVYLACDPDREGEAIAWHVREALDIGERCARIEFNEITERAVLHALEHPRAIDLNRVNAQQARRILDRLVGYLLSPLLQTRVSGWQGRRALSAGRVQSAALRLIVERERQRARFVPREYWRIRALLKPKSRDGRFEAELKKYRGQPVEIPDKKTAEEVTAALRQLNYFVATVERKEVQQPAPPPFRTSTLQREASSKLGLRADETMRLAQELYEGVDLPEGTVGLITYMRTDSTRIAPEARVAAVNFISTQYGADFVGPGSRGKAPRGAQEAHEAIRPTDVFRTPESVAPYLSPRHLALYRLIWRRFVASQMAPAVYDRTRVEVTAGDYVLEAVGRVLKKPGWKLVYGAELPEESNGNGGGAGPDESMSGVEGGPAPPREELAEEGHTEEEGTNAALPELRAGEELDLLDLTATQHFTEPPPRYTEATLVAEMERYGIGRPSTYAPILQTLRQRQYVRMQGRAFVPTRLGVAVCEYLQRFFPQIVDLQFTALMEEKLDAIESGQANWVEVLREFYADLSKWLIEAQKPEPRVLEGHLCPKCGGRLLERFSTSGRFAGCENYPKCDYTRDLGLPIDEHCPQCGSQLEVGMQRTGGLVVRCSNPECGYVRLPHEGEKAESVTGAAQNETKPCPMCGAALKLRSNRRGQKFWGCSRYPECQYTESARANRIAIQTDIQCPKCGGHMVVRSSRKGTFLGCSNYPRCRYARKLTPDEREKYLSAEQSTDSTAQAPRRVETELQCPECSGRLVVRPGSRGWFLGCSNYPQCRYTRDLTPEEHEKYLGGSKGQEPQSTGSIDCEESSADQKV